MYKSQCRNIRNLQKQHLDISELNNLTLIVKDGEEEESIDKNSKV
jgi:hypothetical protein